MLDDYALYNVGDVFAAIDCGLELFVNFFPLQYGQSVVRVVKEFVGIEVDAALISIESTGVALKAL